MFRSSFLISLPFALLMAACASEPPAAATTAAAQPAATCSEKTPITGTSITRRMPCGGATDEQRDNARAQTERMRDDQNRNNPPKLPGTRKP